MSHDQRFSKLGSWLVATIVLLAPLNLFYKWPGSYAYAHGLLLDYLLVKFYASDLAILALLAYAAWYAAHTVRNVALSRSTVMWWVSWVVFLALQGLIHSHPSVWWTVLKLFEFSLLGACLYYFPSWWKTTVVQKSLIWGLGLQFAIIVIQWCTQKALFPYWILGETDLQHSVGIATMVWRGSEHILPYGTTAHPNLAAGVMVGYWAWVMATHTPKTRWLQIVLFGLTTIAVVLTQSLSAGLGLALTVGYRLLMVHTPRKNHHLIDRGGLALAGLIFVVTPMLLSKVPQRFAVSQPSISRRHLLNQTALTVWQAHPWLGVGLNSFVTQADSAMRTTELGRFAQPVHHVGLLWLAETGVAGVWVVGWGVWLVVRHIRQSKSTFSVSALLWLVPIMSLDHYPLSLQTGLWLGVVSLVLCLRQNRRG